MEINLSILSDDAVFRAGLEAMCDQDDRLNLLNPTANDSGGTDGPANSGLRPHVVLLGEPPSKRDLCAKIAQIIAGYRLEKGRPKILVVSQNDADEVIVAALRTGVHGYLARVASPDELFHALQIVAKGGAVFSPTIAARLSRYFSIMQMLPELAGLTGLTGREFEILELLAEGLDNRQIARRLFLAEKTVRNYISRIFTKLEVHDRASAALRARDAGFGTQPDPPADPQHRHQPLHGTPAVPHSSLCRDSRHIG